MSGPSANGPSDDDAMVAEFAAQTNRRWVLRHRPERVVTRDCFELQEGTVPEPADGEFLVRVVYLSLAPVMAQYVIDGGVIADPVAIGAVMRGRGAGIVVRSRHPAYREGDAVHGSFGWQDYALSDGSGMTFHYQAEAPLSLALGLLGLTGFTAYFGLVDAGELRAGDRVLVSGAVGGVGSVAGPLAGLLGAGKVVGLCGGLEKCALATSRLNYDEALDYRGADLEQQLDRALPDGIDVYFDNTGGRILELSIARMRDRGRIALCGAISQYEQTQKRGPANYFDLVYRNARTQGFHIYSYRDRYGEAESRMAAWYRDGQLPVLEDRLTGLAQMPDALRRLYEGANSGKQVVQIAEEPA